jgi:hypothetical protein
MADPASWRCDFAPWRDQGSNCRTACWRPFWKAKQDPDLFLIEIATFPEARVEEQMVRDALLVLLDRRKMPEVLTLVLRPRGNYSLPSERQFKSRLGLAKVQANWRVIELWNFPAEALLASEGIGLIPWVPLSSFEGPPERVLQRCRVAIDQRASADERANLLAVTQVMTRLRYNDPNLLALFGGIQTMIESPLIQEIVANSNHKLISKVLQSRLGEVPRDILQDLKCVLDYDKLENLATVAATCADWDAFRQELHIKEANVE